MAGIREESEIELEECEKIVGNWDQPSAREGSSYGCPSGLNPRVHI